MIKSKSKFVQEINKTVCACHPCAGAVLIFSVSFQFYRMFPEGNPRRGLAQERVPSNFLAFFFLLSVNCKVQGAKCEVRVRSAMCKVQGARCKVQRAKCEVRSAKCEVRSAKCEVRSAKCEVQSAKCKVQTMHASIIQ